MKKQDIILIFGILFSISSLSLCIISVLTSCWKYKILIIKNEDTKYLKRIDYGLIEICEIDYRNISISCDNVNVYKFNPVEILIRIIFILEIFMLSVSSIAGILKLTINKLYFMNIYACISCSLGIMFGVIGDLLYVLYPDLYSYELNKDNTNQYMKYCVGIYLSLYTYLSSVPAIFIYYNDINKKKGKYNFISTV